jgi:glycosyltransferase 2 family protein
MKMVRKINLHRSPLLRYFLGLMISALTLYLALRNVAIDEFATAFRQALPRFIVYALISVVCNNLAKTFRWRVLLGPAGKQISIWKLFLTLMAGQTLNAIYPARVGDLSRALVIGSAGPGRVYTLGTIVIEKVLDLMAYAILFLILILLMPLPAWVNSSAYTLILVTILVTGATLLVTLFPARFMAFVGKLAQILPARISGYVRERLQYAVQSLDVLQSRTGLAWLAVWSALIWGTAILTNHLTLLAMQIHLPLIASLLVLVALQAGISIPSVPGSIGVFEYICVLALAIFQVDQAAALSFAIILHMLVFLPIISLGLIAVWFLDLGHHHRNSQ